MNESNEAMTQEQFKSLLTDEQRKFLRNEFNTLLRETEDKDDGMKYLGDIASDFIEEWPEMDEHWESLRTYLISEFKIYSPARKLS